LEKLPGGYMAGFPAKDYRLQPANSQRLLRWRP